MYICNNRISKNVKDDLDGDPKVLVKLLLLS